MEQLPQLPVDLETGTQTVQKVASNIEDSPKKFLGVMIGASLVVSLLFFGIFYLSQNLYIAEKQKKDSQNNSFTENQTNSANFDQQRSRDLSDIAKALRAYKVNYGEYPFNLESLVPDYLYRLPVDPSTKKNYDYRPNVDRKSFELKAKLANGDELVESGD